MNKYDCFYAIASKGRIAIKELQELARDKTPQHVYYHLVQLEREKLVRRVGGLVEVLHNARSRELFSLLQFCVSNNLDYAFYFSELTLTYLAKVSGRFSYTFTQTQITDRLEKDTFLVRYQKKPFLGRVLQHSFLRRLLMYHHKRSVQGGKKINELLLDAFLEKHKGILRKGVPINRVGFIHHSLLLEGNLLTLRETELLLKEKIAPQKPLKDAQEVLGYNAAISEVDARLHSDLTIEMILSIHAKAMQHMDFAGSIRKENVVIKGNLLFRTAKHHQITALLTALCNEVNSFKSKDVVEIINQAADVHNQFQYIHPFLDGNSRTTRLLLYWFLRHHHVGFSDIPLGFTTEYLAATKGASKRKDKNLRRLLKELLIQQIQRA